MVSRNNKLITVSCAENSVVVRPWGANDEYPPTISSGPPQGVYIEVDLGAEGTLHLNITNELTIVDSGVYQRFIGSVYGDLNGGNTIEGRALHEQFKLIPG